jgi:hypothetical protein
MLIGFLLHRAVTLTPCAAALRPGVGADRRFMPDPAAARAAAGCPVVRDGT